MFPQGGNVTDISNFPFPIKVLSSDRNIGVTFVSHINLENHVMNTCKTAFFHLRNTYRKNSELSLSKRSWDTCSCFYFIRAEFLQRSSVWVTTTGSRSTTVCLKLCSSPRGWEHITQPSTSSITLATNQTPNNVQNTTSYV